jgi:hypothetical protein
MLFPEELAYILRDIYQDPHFDEEREKCWLRLKQFCLQKEAYLPARWSQAGQKRCIEVEGLLRPVVYDL